MVTRRRGPARIATWNRPGMSLRTALAAVPLLILLNAFFVAAALP